MMLFFDATLTLNSTGAGRWRIERFYNDLFPGTPPNIPAQIKKSVEIAKRKQTFIPVELQHLINKNIEISWEAELKKGGNVAVRIFIEEGKFSKITALH